MRDDNLEQFAATGATLPPGGTETVVECDGARIWCASFGAGTPVFLLHGGLGHSGNWAYQILPLVEAGFRPIVVDTRGHGRSTRDDRPYTYGLLAADLRIVMAKLQIGQAAMVGWSDGACTALVLAAETPERSLGVLFFACNMDDSGTLPFVMTPKIENCIGRHQADYRALSSTPDSFQDFMDAVGKMQRTQPNYSAGELASLRVPVTVVQAEHDEFIRPEHAEYLAETIPGAELVRLPGVSHFAPLQRPEVFNAAMLDFLAGLPGRSA